MIQNKLGQSDLKISPLTVGCWSFGGGDGSYWGAQSQQDVNDLVAEALAMGVNFFDTAFGYNDGKSEESLGIALRGKRQDALICNKIPIQTADQLSRYEETIQASLKRLQTDVIDIMMIHWPTRDEGLLRANLEALQQMREKGLVREIGVSNFGLRTLNIAREMEIPVVANEFAYNLMTRGIEKEILPYCHANQIGVAAYMPIMQGILTGKYAHLEDIPLVRKRSVHFKCEGNPESRHGGPGAEDEVLYLLDELNRIAQETGIKEGHLAIAWLIAQSGVSTVIAGCRTVDQLRDNVQAVETKLDSSILAALDAASLPLNQKMPDQLDLWQIGDKSRIW
ncbi:MAG: aldo/keto reductase [Bacillota bacterium]|nr:aldo/keto reductase [Bacillota bacterium]